MGYTETLSWLQTYDIWLLLVGIGILAASALPRFLSDEPLSMPIVLTALGAIVVGLPTGLQAPDPLHLGAHTERLTELAVIIALAAAGLKIDRPPGFRAWGTTWRLLGITMVLTIILAAWLGWYVAGFVPATAALLGAVLAPTDPVLASEVQVGPPGRGAEVAPDEDREEDEVRFSLTAEAGLNDGLAFPFTNLAIAMAIFGTAPAEWLGGWLLVDVLYKITVAVVIGIVLGYALGTLILRIPAKSEIARSIAGLSALAATLIVYAATQLVGGYGFIATFVGAVVIRHHRGEHQLHGPLYRAAEHAERLLAAAILIAFGAAIAGGLLAPLGWRHVLVALLVFFVVRPLTGLIGLIGAESMPWRERAFVASFGIRGIGSMYYLAFALNEETFQQTEELWATVALVILLSIVLHGTLAAPLTDRLDRRRKKDRAG